MKRAIKAHSRDFIAIAVLFLVGIGVSAFILSNQRLYLPKWVPGVGTDFYNVNAEFSTAQAVVPGQGQTVDIAGVPVGEIGNVDLKNGVAVVQLKIRRKYAPIYRDAHMLLRPKTGLKDMIVEMDPGTRTAGRLPAGGTIPVQNTAPDINLDETLSVLDSDTRTYLQILVNGGGEALSGKKTPAALRETLR
jgi:phospholipid/cholesterol/gamma-HCH transport system substrate-binding protein